MKKSKLNTEDGMGLGYEMYDDIVEFIQEFKETEASTTFYPDQKLILDALVKRLKYRHEINGHQQL
tara:strand:+ start:747 stop:944 length:198 start_codon:yes stop_codon:yes gene_type:complete